MPWSQPVLGTSNVSGHSHCGHSDGLADCRCSSGTNRRGGKASDGAVRNIDSPSPLCYFYLRQRTFPTPFTATPPGLLKPLPSVSTGRAGGYRAIDATISLQPLVPIFGDKKRRRGGPQPRPAGLLKPAPSVLTVELEDTAPLTAAISSPHFRIVGDKDVPERPPLTPEGPLKLLRPCYVELGKTVPLTAMISFTACLRNPRQRRCRHRPRPRIGAVEAVAHRGDR